MRHGYSAPAVARSAESWRVAGGPGYVCLSPWTFRTSSYLRGSAGWCLRTGHLAAISRALVIVRSVHCRRQAHRPHPRRSRRRYQPHPAATHRYRCDPQPHRRHLPDHNHGGNRRRASPPQRVPPVPRSHSPWCTHNRDPRIRGLRTKRAAQRFALRSLPRSARGRCWVTRQDGELCS